MIREDFGIQGGTGYFFRSRDSVEDTKGAAFDKEGVFAAPTEFLGVREDS